MNIYIHSYDNPVYDNPDNPLNQKDTKHGVINSFVAGYILKPANATEVRLPASLTTA